MSIYREIAEELGELVTKKNEAYGSSFAKAGEFLKLLYPHGLSVDEFEDALLLVRVFDKMMRIATDRDALGECPWQDLAGYGILGVSLHHARKEAAAHCVNDEKVTARQEIEIWVSRAAHSSCSWCGATLGDDAVRFESLVTLQGRSFKAVFGSRMCCDAAHSRYAELDGAPQ